MLVYKYRGGDDKIFERDLESLEKNCFWSSSLRNLNDPQENMVSTDKFVKQSKIFDNLFSGKVNSNLSMVNQCLDDLLSHNERVGIYSLSTSFKDKLLWAHYANSHKGFCIEYDLDKLVDSYIYESKSHFPVLYNEKPTELELGNISETSARDNSLLQKIFACKSKEWEYEKEYRIVTNDSGLHNYDFEAVKSIYFGMKMPDYQKREVIKRLEGRSIKFYQIETISNDYSLQAILIKDIDFSNISYFKEIPLGVTTDKPIKYEIFEKKYYKLNKKGNISIELESSISDYEIRWLANMIKNHLFYGAEKIFIFYYLKGQERDDFAWATSHILNDNIEVLINDFLRQQ
ncbi:DUF2971 domain-containing protein [Flavobacterium procerum]|uniref:DUF2971 domain-containing protein n=1 Tax=Flavobacterium procerum TaxID=1455569 RepID=A0ABV6BLD4_9FLAO